MPAAIFESDRFTFHAGTFVTEASDLGIGVPGDRISIRSARTGQVAAFRKVATNRDGEGEVTGWTFVSADPAAPAPCNVEIFND